MIMDKFSLSGKVAIIIGASRGLGQGMARALAEAGADLGIVARTISSLKKFAEEVNRFGRKCLALQADVSILSEIQEAVDEVRKKFGKIDILINSQGIQIKKSALEMTEQDWEELMAVNLKSVFFSCQIVGQQMINQKRGKIINVASLTSVIGLPNTSIYGTSKGGISSLTRALAIEWAPYNINVNAILPGFYETQLTAELFNNEKIIQWILNRIPFRRIGLPEDLAGAAVFLSSEASDYITGQIIPVDGGWLAF